VLSDFCVSWAATSSFGPPTATSAAAKAAINIAFRHVCLVFIVSSLFVSKGFD
jgi:hypothetical protein